MQFFLFYALCVFYFFENGQQLAYEVGIGVVGMEYYANFVFLSSYFAFVFFFYLMAFATAGNTVEEDVVSKLVVCGDVVFILIRNICSRIRSVIKQTHILIYIVNTYCCYIKTFRSTNSRKFLSIFKCTRIKPARNINLSSSPSIIFMFPIRNIRNSIFVTF